MIGQPFERIARAGEVPHHDHAATRCRPRRALAADNYDEAIDSHRPHGGAGQARVGGGGQHDGGADRVDGRGAMTKQVVKENAQDAMDQLGAVTTAKRPGCFGGPFANCGRSGYNA
jgi:hypothetical protein